MAKIQLKFIDFCNDNEFISTELSSEYDENTDKDIDVISIIGNCGYDIFHIVLDKSTAIKFAKTLRTEINKIDTEVNNG